MTSFSQTSRRSVPGGIAGWLGLTVVLGVGGAASPAIGLEGTIDVRHTDQTARSDTGTYASDWRRESLTLRQSFRLTSLLTLDARFRTLREISGSEIDGFRQNSERETVQPDLRLSYRTHPLNVGIQTSRLERRASGATALAPESTRIQFGGWLNARLGSASRLTSSITETRSEETGVVGDLEEATQRNGYLLAEQGLGGTWQARYRLSGLSGDVTSRQTRRTQFTHAVELRGDPEFADGRGNTSFRFRSNLSSQRTETGSGNPESLYRAPFLTGFVLDDTPEEYDPLEDDPVGVPELYDRDRDSRTRIDLGDDAPAVREFGGDYRNLAYDYGEPVEFASAVLYVDQHVAQSGLVDWLVYVSDDPDGRLWEPLPADRYTLAYRQWGNLYQGWEIDFAEGVSGRHVKFVSLKFGNTGIAHLFVTELEVDVRQVTPVVETTDRTQNHVVDAGVGYDVTSRVRVGYHTSLRKRVFDDETSDLDSVNHAFTSRWTGERTRLSGRYDLHRVTGARGRNTDVASTHLSAMRGRPGGSSATLSWNRSDDRSESRRRMTDTYTLASVWRPASRLRFNQRVSHGRRRDDVTGIRARSVVLTTTMQGAPVPTLTFNLDRSDRWVSREAGSGFERFNDSGAEMTWSPFPLVSLSGDARYQVRDTEEWSTRQTLTWSPFPGGRIETHLTGSSFWDSRSDVRRLGAGLTMRWRPRQGLLVEASVDAYEYEVRSERSSPISTFVHMGWSF